MRWDEMSREERVEALTRMHPMSALQIAKELNCTKRAIIGYWFRNPSIPRADRPGSEPGAAERKPRPKTDPKLLRPKMSAQVDGMGQPGRIRNVTKLQALARDKAGKALPLYVPKFIAEPAGPGVSMLERTSRQCSYIRKERGPHGAMCCGEPTLPGTAWCSWHYDAVYVPKAKRGAALKDIDRAAKAAAPTEATVLEAAE